MGQLLSSIKQPHEFRRRVLLATTGLYPQILTETLYALARLRNPAFVPNEIHVVTTARGAAAVADKLLASGEARLGAMAREFDLEGLADALSPERIHVFRDSDGAALDDVDTVESNSLAADLINDLIRRLTGDDDCALHVSLAGGRKTMGFLLGYVLTLYARPQDQLSHVLVDARLESHPEFFYPPAAPRDLPLRGGGTVSTAEANISLAEIDILPLRLGLPDELVSGDSSFSETVSRARQGFVEPVLRLDSTRRRVMCHGRIVSLPPLPFAVYAWLARRRKGGSGAGGAVNWWEAGKDDIIGLEREYRAAGGKAVGPWARGGEHLRDMLEPTKNKINAVLVEELGFFARAYAIVQKDKVPGTSYRRIGLELDPEAISFGPVEEEEAVDDELA